MARNKTVKTNAMRELDRAKIAYEAHRYEDDGEEASGLGVAIAERLGEDPARSFKTLVCRDAKGGLVVCCIPVACELDLKAAARAVGEKSLSMLHVAELFDATGYVRGGCSPLGIRARHRVVIDATCEAGDEIHVSGGKRGLSLTLAPADLVRATGAVVAPIARA